MTGMLKKNMVKNKKLSRYLFQFINLLFAKKYLKWFIIPVLLVICSLLLIVLNGSDSFSVLVSQHSKNNIISYGVSDLLRGKKIEGNFISTYPNLGIVAVRFDTKGKSVDDTVIFRIRENNERSWHYEGTYNTNQFQDNGFFSFGFPTLVNSSGKRYMFEIESVRGTTLDSINLTSKEPIYVAKYQFVDWKSNPLFIILKIENSLMYVNISKKIFYMLPLIIYILLITLFKNKVTPTIIFIIICSLLILEQRFEIKLLIGIGVMGIISFLLYWRLLLESRFYYFLAIVSVIFSAVFVHLKLAISEVFATFTFYIMVFAIFITFIEQLKSHINSRNSNKRKRK